jgi:hypothetical protein
MKSSCLRHVMCRRLFLPLSSETGAALSKSILTDVLRSARQTFAVITDGTAERNCLTNCTGYSLKFYVTSYCKKASNLLQLVIIC